MLLGSSLSTIQASIEPRVVDLAFCDSQQVSRTVAGYHRCSTDNSLPGLDNRLIANSEPFPPATSGFDGRPSHQELLVKPNDPPKINTEETQQDDIRHGIEPLRYLSKTALQKVATDNIGGYPTERAANRINQK
jgi:hypothetical protein